MENTIKGNGRKIAELVKENFIGGRIIII